MPPSPGNVTFTLSKWEAALRRSVKRADYTNLSIDVPNVFHLPCLNSHSPPPLYYPIPVSDPISYTAFTIFPHIYLFFQVCQGHWAQERRREKRCIRLKIKLTAPRNLSAMNRLKYMPRHLKWSFIYQAF